MKRLALLLMMSSLGLLPVWAEEIRIRVVDPQEKVIVGAVGKKSECVHHAG